MSFLIKDVMSKSAVVVSVLQADIAFHKGAQQLQATTTTPQNL